MPDVIITDICSLDGDGIILTQELRNAGYNGIIIALTAYRETEISGEMLMRYGFDGMISNPHLGATLSTRSLIVQSMQNYFYYLNLYGWMR